MNRRYQPYAAVGVVLSFGLALVVLSTILAPTKRPDIWFEAGKAGLQLAIVAVIGGIAAAVLRYFDAMREDRRRFADYLLTLLRQVVSAYNQVKAARRILRAFGFSAPMAPTLRPEQVTEFLAQMKALNQAQLSLELIAREMRSHPAFQSVPTLCTAVETAEKYVGQVLDDWEKNGAALLAGDSSVALKLSNLQSFLDDSDRSFEAGAATPMDLVESGLRDKVRSSIGGSLAILHNP
jgi:hypothetical protein